MPCRKCVRNNLLKAVQSILSNDANYELIIVFQETKPDDITFFNALEPSKIKVIEDNGVGISRARNKGIKKTQGDWFLLLDDDVEIKPNLLFELEKLLSKTKEHFYYGNLLIKGTTKPYRDYPLKNKDINFINFNLICSVMLVFDRYVLDKIGLFDENIGAGMIHGAGEETDFIIRSLFANIKIKYLDLYSVYHDKHEATNAKLIAYAAGNAAIYKKYFGRKDYRLTLKLIADLFVRILLCLTFRKKRFVFFYGFTYGLFRKLKRKET